MEQERLIHKVTLSLREFGTPAIFASFTLVGIIYVYLAKAPTTIDVLNPKTIMDKTNEKRTDSVTDTDLIELESVTRSLDPNVVRKVSKDEYKEAALSLALAFENDESSRYFIDTPDRADWTEQQKWDLHLSIMEYVVYAHCLKGLVTTVGPDYACVSLWMPPGENMDDWYTQVRSGMWRLNYKLSPEGRDRFFTEFLPLLHQTKADVLGPRDDEVWYLLYIGTRPDGRGKGYARKLIENVTRQADAEGRACYLESSNAINVQIYGKLGFEVKREIFLIGTEPKIQLDIMVREPGAKPVTGPLPMSTAAPGSSE